MTGKTAAQWQREREDPAFEAMAKAVVRLRKAWPAAHVVAHRDEATGRVTFHLHVREHDLPRLHDLLGQVPVDQMCSGTTTTFHFRGGRRDMDRLLGRLGPTRATVMNDDDLYPYCADCGVPLAEYPSDMVGDDLCRRCRRKADQIESEGIGAGT